MAMKPWKQNLCLVALGYLIAKAPELVPMAFHLAMSILNGLAQAISAASHGQKH